MADHLQTLKDNVNRWRNSGIEEYWVQIDFIGAAMNRMGIHELTTSGGKLYHERHGDWREIETGSDFWLYSIPGTFAWTRDMLTKILPAAGVGDEGIELEFNEEYGYVQHLRVKAAKRDASNITFDVKKFGVGTHPEFNK